MIQTAGGPMACQRFFLMRILCGNGKGLDRGYIAAEASKVKPPGRLTPDNHQ